MKLTKDHELIFWWLLAVVLLVVQLGCTPQPLESDKSAAPQGNNERFEITTAQHFYDGDKITYIVVLYDKKSTREFLAVTGAGLVEIK